MTMKCVLMQHVIQDDAESVGQIWVKLSCRQEWYWAEHTSEDSPHPRPALLGALAELNVNVRRPWVTSITGLEIQS